MTMTTSLQHLLDNNRAWAQRMEQQRPGFFSQLAHQQTPKYLWIGCSDSRVPANEITGLDPAEGFVHRNVANVGVPSHLHALYLIHAVAFVLVVYRVNDLPRQGSLVRAGVFLLPFLLAVAFLGLGISRLFRERESAMQALLVTSLPAIFVSGFSNAAVILQQRVGTLAGKVFETTRAGA